MLLWFAAACGPARPDPPAPSTPATDSAADSGGDIQAPTDCDPLSIDLVGEWLDADLPLGERDGLVGIALGDLDGDGWLDGLFAGAGGAIVLRNDGAGGLSLDPDWTVDGFPLPESRSVALADLDGDGDADAFLGREEDDDLILWSDGAGGFSGRLMEQSAAGSTLTGAFADADGDGDLDLFAAVGIADVQAEAIIAGEETGEPNRLYLQEGGAFVLSEGALPSRDPSGHTFEGAWLDADRDGDLDIYVANDAGPFLDPNRLLINDGAGRFTDAQGCGCDLEMLAMGAAVGDAEGDGWPDIYVTDVGGPNYLKGLGGARFVDVTLVNGSEVPAAEDAMTSWGTTFLDVDLDGCQDLLVMFGQSGKNLDAFDEMNMGWEDGAAQPDVLLRGHCAGGFVRVEGRASTTRIGGARWRSVTSTGTACRTCSRRASTSFASGERRAAVGRGSP